MKFPKRTEEFVAFCKNKGIRLLDKKQLPKGDVYIAETDLEPPTHEFPWGYYQTSYFIARGERFICGRWMDFDAMHDTDREWTQEQKRQARINSALEEAKKVLTVI